MPTPQRPWILSSLVLAALLSAGATAAAQAQDWSRFRGPNGTGIVPDAGYPTEFGPDRNLMWRAAVRPGKSSPVLSRAAHLPDRLRRGRALHAVLRPRDRAPGLGARGTAGAA